MKTLSAFAIIVSLATVAACGSDSPNTPNTPSGTVTQTYTASLKPSEEVPAVTGAEAAGSGTVSITLNATRDPSGNITTANATFVVNLNGFPAGTPINMAHIHQAATGQNGDVVVSTTLAPGEVALNGGSGSFTRNGVAISPDLANQLMSNPAGFYFNVHSTLNPGGVARGQLARIQ